MKDYYTAQVEEKNNQVRLAKAGAVYAFERKVKLIYVGQNESDYEAIKKAIIELAKAIACVDALEERVKYAQEDLDKEIAKEQHEEEIKKAKELLEKEQANENNK